MELKWGSLTIMALNVLRLLTDALFGKYHMSEVSLVRILLILFQLTEI